METLISNVDLVFIMEFTRVFKILEEIKDF